MNKQDFTALMNSIYPGFFEKEYIRNLPDDCICDEMVLPLDEFNPSLYDKKMDDSVSFGYYQGDLAQLQEAVGKVAQDWIRYYNGHERIYCGYINGEVASFCLISDMGTHTINGRTLKVGGPGCVGTLPHYRNRGIGLTMVKQVTQILKDEGYDYGYIHYTGVAPWYEKLGYKISVRWGNRGIL